jgi:sirohydrochlorin cobaltochelatase
MEQFVELRRRLTPLAHVQACFMSMAEPGLELALRQAAISGVQRVVVQPHLLFAGALVDRIAQTVARFSTRFRSVQWLTTAQLGPSELVALSVLERARAAHPMATRTAGSIDPNET